MKKCLPLLLMVMLAFAGCQRGPATYEPADNPHDVVPHAEKFVKKVSKQAKHYTAEEWDATVEQFIIMGKNYVESRRFMTEEERMQFDQTRLDFMQAISGNMEVVKQVKEEYSKIVDF
jgi:hypothetical protein